MAGMIISDIMLIEKRREKAGYSNGDVRIV